MSDRTVHALRNDGWEIVRYDRSGKWWSERDGERFKIPTVRDAVEWASEDLNKHYSGRHGGKSFDRLMSKLHV